MSDATIDLGSLCVVIVVVVCSWGLALLCSLTCWNSFKKSQPSHIYCTQCSTLQHYPVQPHPSTIPPLQYVNQYQSLPHTAERLGEAQLSGGNSLTTLVESPDGELEVRLVMGPDCHSTVKMEVLGKHAAQMEM